MAFELGWASWKLAFFRRLDEKPWLARIPAREIGAMKRAIAKARVRFGLATTSPTASCYEAGRDGFWLDRRLKQMGVRNVVVDSGSIEVDRRARRAKTDRLDAEDLVTMLVRFVSGEAKVWHAVHVPTPEQEDSRHPQREIRTLKKEETRTVNRARRLLASQGVAVKMGRRGLLVPLESLRIWDGSPLPSGLKVRLEQELSRHRVIHEQLLALEAERNRSIREDGGALGAIRRRLRELKAIGPTTAETVTREILFRDFKNRRQVGSYSGLTPSPYQSGDMSRDSGISRAGNRHARGVLVDVAWDWLRYQPQSAPSRWYQRRFGSGGPRLRKIGIVALARKLLIALWRYGQHGIVPERAQRKALATGTRPTRRFMSHGWMHPPETRAWSSDTDDRRLDGADAEELPLNALLRTQHLVFGMADTGRRWSEGQAPRLQKEAASLWNPGRETRDFLERGEPRDRHQ